MLYGIIAPRLDINRRLTKDFSVLHVYRTDTLKTVHWQREWCLVMAMGKRDRLEIIAAILDLCSKPRSKTRVMYGTNLSWKMLQQYLGHMQSQGLLEVKDDSTKFITTVRGQDFLEKWKELQELM